MKKGKWMYLGREQKTVSSNKAADCFYGISNSRIKFNGVDGGFLSILDGHTYCPKAFRRITGLSLKPGEQARIRLEMEEQ